MGDKPDEPSSPDGQGTPDRKITKPLMEKRRRARINSCLTELKALLLTNADEKESGRFAKLEKADILELTVKYLRNRQQSAISGNHTALYRAGFNKCMEELSTFLSADDDHSANLRLKLTNHLAEILCSMDGLNDASSKGVRERSNVSPGFQVSSSSDEMKCLTSPGCPISLQTFRDTLNGEAKVAEEPTARSPEGERFKPCSVSGALPTVVNTAGSLCQTLGVVDNPAVNIPTYTTIPVLPTVVTPGQVPTVVTPGQLPTVVTPGQQPTVVTPGQLLLLLPNNNSNGKLAFQLPAYTSGYVNHVYQPRDFQPLVLEETTRNSHSNSINSSKIGSTDSVSNQSMNDEQNYIKLEPAQLAAGYPCHRTENSINMLNCVSSVPVFNPIAAQPSSEVAPEKGNCKTSPDTRASNLEYKIRNVGSPDEQGSMWRPW